MIVLFDFLTTCQGFFPGTPVFMLADTQIHRHPMSDECPL